MKKRVVITGIGLWTACGKGWQSFWESLRAGRSALTPFSQFTLPDQAEPFLAGEIRDFDPREHIKQRKSLKVMSRETQLAVAVSAMALRDAALDGTGVDSDFFGVSVGCGIINTELEEIAAGILEGKDENGGFDIRRFGRKGITSMFPLWFLKYLPNMPACHISMNLGLRGPSNTITTSSCAATQAIGEAARVIERGDAALMLAGGADSKLNGIGLSRLRLLDLLAGSCPRKEERDFLNGIIPAEGAGFLLLEDYDHARKRGAQIYAEVAGYGSAAEWLTDPRGTPERRAKQSAIKRAIQDAGVCEEDIRVVVANASGLNTHDTVEAEAIKTLWGQALKALRVTASKRFAGHTLYASGVVDTVLAALCLHKGEIPPAFPPDASFQDDGLPWVSGSFEKRESQAALVNSFGLTGQNACLVLKRYGV